MIQRYRNDIEAKGEIEKKDEMIFGLRENKLYLENDLALKVEEIATLKNEIAKACVIIAEGLKIVEELEQQIAGLKSLVDGAMTLVSIWDGESPAQREWKADWLAKAREALK